MFTRSLLKNAPGGAFGRILRLPLRLIPNSAVLTVKSGINFGMKWVVGSSVHGCWLGHYEHDKQELIRQLVKPGMKVFDIGANAGFYTLAFSRLVGDTGRVFAFEPFAENAANILRHVSLNRIQNVTLIQAAVAQSPGITGFTIRGSNSMGSLAEATGTYSVPVVALDALIESDVIPMPDVIKMDVEGAESRVLDGARRLLGVRHTTLLIALHGYRQRVACLALLDEYHYKVSKLDTGEESDGLEEIYATPTSKTHAGAESDAGGSYALRGHDNA